MSMFKNTFYNIVLNVQKMSIFKSRSHIKNMFGFDKRFMSSKNDVVSNFIHVFAKMDGILITLYVISKNIHVSKNIRQFILFLKFENLYLYLYLLIKQGPFLRFFYPFTIDFF